MKIIIIGNGGHSKVIQELIQEKNEYQVIAILDDKYPFATERDGKVYAPVKYFDHIISSKIKVMIAIGHNSTRKLLSKQLPIRKEQYLTAFHPSAVISPTAKIGYGSVIMPGAYINSDATIGEHCIINTGSIVEHDSSIGDFTHISPNATLTGNVSIGEGVHIGSSATVIPGIDIGNWSVVGAGSTVIRNIPPYSTAVGCPTRIVKENVANMEIRL